MTRHARRKVMQRTARQAGLTLVELMVALTIGLFLVIGLISLLVSTSYSRTELDKTSRQIENGRYALQLITTDVQHAGFLGTYSPPLAAPPVGPTWRTPDPCNPAAANYFPTASPLDVPVLIFGYDGPTADATPPSCTANRAAGTDVLVVRRVSTTPVTPGSPQQVAGETYMQVSACAPLNPPFVVSSNAVDFTLQTKDCDPTKLASLHKYIVRVYYVASCNDCIANDGIPTLKMAEFINGAITVRPLVEGIQNMQVDYGIDTNADGAPDCYANDPSSAVAPACAGAPYVWNTAENWANVVAARIYVLARNNEATADWTDTRTYNLGLSGAYTPAAGDKYKRHVYSAVARVVNPSARRETP